MSKKDAIKKSAPNKLPSSWSLFKKTWLEFKNYWKPLGGVLLVYAIIYFIFVMGLSFSSNVQDNLVGDSKISDAFSSVVSQFTNNALIGSAQSDSTVVIQFLLFLVASMAFIWTLRKFQSVKNVSIRDAYYNGTSALVATVIVTIILILTLLPGLIGSSILAVALQSGSSGLEVAIVSFLAFVFLMLSFYMFVMIWPSFYIVSLPNTRPVGAVKSAAKLTKGRRMAILRKIFILFASLMALIIIILMPIALIMSFSVPYLAYVILFIAFGVAHTYLYLLYRSLM